MNRSGTTPAEQVGHDESSATWIDLDGVVNMRDLGGLPTRDGRQIRPRRLIRSDNLQDLTEADLRRLLSMGVTDVLDLRTRREVDAVGPGPLREAGCRVSMFIGHAPAQIEASARIGAAVVEAADRISRALR